MGSPTTAQRLLRRARLSALLLSSVLCLTLAICYALRPDAAAAVTVWPVWIWLLPGLALLGLGSSRLTRPAAFSAALLWLLYLAAFAEEPRSLLRAATRPHTDFEAARIRGEAVRVVSLNCSGGSLQAAAEVKPHDPDILLLQEVPARPKVLRLARDMFGPGVAVAGGPDAAIIVRGEVLAAPRGLPIHFTSARVRLSSGVELNVLSLRLSPPVFRLDLWSPDHWRAQRTSRQVRRAQVRRIVAHLETLPETIPLILGGDFNAPAGDAVVRMLPRNLRDAFRASGRGWGNTVLNEYPVLRFDQIWASDQFRSVEVRAEKTQHSDHRMVVCDLVLQPDPSAAGERED